MTAADLGAAPDGPTTEGRIATRTAASADAAIAPVAAQAPSVWRSPPDNIDLTMHVARDDIQETELEAVVTNIQRALGQIGVASRVGGSFDWLANSRTRKVHMSIVTRDSGTTLRAHERLAPLAGAIYGAGVGGVGVFGIGWTGFILAFNSFHSVPIAAGVWGALVAASWGAARAIYTRVVARRQRQLADLVTQIGDGLRTHSLRPELSGPP